MVVRQDAEVAMSFLGETVKSDEGTEEEMLSPLIDADSKAEEDFPELEYEDEATFLYDFFDATDTWCFCFGWNLPAIAAAADPGSFRTGWLVAATRASRHPLNSIFDDHVLLVLRLSSRHRSSITPASLSLSLPYMNRRAHGLSLSLSLFASFFIWACFS